jgi:hypothetical protein
MPNNLTIFSDTNKENIQELLLAHQRYCGIHATNGTYAYKPEIIVPTVLAGFEYVSDTTDNPSDIFLLAVNSNASMKGIMDKKGLGMEGVEDELIRAEKVAVPLALQHPKREIIVIFYDEETPRELYGFLKKGGVKLHTLFKYGYGTDPSAPKIEGAANFDSVLAFPMINDLRPVCHAITAVEDQTRTIQVVSLTDKLEGNPKSPYLSKSGQILFPVHEALLDYSASKEIKRRSPKLGL